MRLLKFLPLLFILLDACVERFDTPVVYASARIVVDGLITNKPGPYEVKLFYTSSLDENLETASPVTNATVKILDDLGNEEVLSETEKGKYETSSTHGVVGRRYKLYFQTADGREYESTEQEMLPAGEVDNLYAEFAEHIINKDDLSKPQDVFRIYFDSKGSESGQNLYRWRWSGTFEANTFPQYRRKPFMGGPVWVPDPLKCSGHIARDTFLLVQVGPCECCTCWVEEYSEQARVSPNELIATSSFTNVKIAEIPVEWKKFNSKYYLKLEQLSLSEEMYDFWKKVQAQQEGNANIFQPNVIRIRGNIKSLTDPDEEVSGVFAVSAVAERAMFIYRSDIPKILPVDSVFQDCRIEYPGSTNQRPSFW